MDRYLKPVECYSDSSLPIFRRSDNQKFTCTDYSGFCVELAESLFRHKSHDFGIRWNEYPFQSLIFYIKITGFKENPYFRLTTYLSNTFLYVMQKHLKLPELTVILSMPRNRNGGMRVHIPEYKISRDDYTFLCSSMKRKCKYQDGDVRIELDCPDDMPLVACDIDESPYVPVQAYKIQGKKLYDKVLFSDSGNLSSVFDRLKHASYSWIEAACHMMPVPYSETATLFYPTRIVPETRGRNTVAQFRSHVNDRHYMICKDDALQKSGGESTEPPFCHKFLKRHAYALLHFHSSDHVLTNWYHIFRSSLRGFSHFGGIENRIAGSCYHLKDSPDALKKILTNSECVLPVYYALCNMLEYKSSDSIKKDLSELYEPVKHILDKVWIVPEASSKLNGDTILRCAFDTSVTAEGHFWKHIGMGWKWILEQTDTVEEMQKHLRCVQEKHFPIARYRGNLFAWDPIVREWQHAKNEKEDVLGLLSTIFDYMKFGFEGFKKMPSALRAYLSKEKDWINCLANSIIVETGEIPKCFTKPHSSDLMEQYFGRNVPEYFFIPHVEEKFETDYIDISDDSDSC